MTTTDTIAPIHLQKLLDRAEITDLVHRLGMCLDEARFDELPALLVEDATLRTPGGGVHGLAAIVAQATRIHAAEDGVIHTITNILIDVAGDTATARANLVVSFASPLATDQPGHPPLVRSIQGQIYRFDFVRRDAAWRISKIDTSPVWMTGHLDRSPAPPR